MESGRGAVGRGRFQTCESEAKIWTGQANRSARNTYKQTRAAALAHWRCLLDAWSTGGVGVTETGSHSSDSSRGA